MNLNTKFCILVIFCTGPMTMPWFNKSSGFFEGSRHGDRHQLKLFHFFYQMSVRLKHLCRTCLVMAGNQTILYCFRQRFMAFGSCNCLVYAMRYIYFILIYRNDSILCSFKCFIPKIINPGTGHVLSELLMLI